MVDIVTVTDAKPSGTIVTHHIHAVSVAKYPDSLGNDVPMMAPMSKRQQRKLAKAQKKVATDAAAMMADHEEYLHSHIKHVVPLTTVVHHVAVVHGHPFADHIAGVHHQIHSMIANEHIEHTDNEKTIHESDGQSKKNHIPHHKTSHPTHYHVDGGKKNSLQDAHHHKKQVIPIEDVDDNQEFSVQPIENEKHHTSPEPQLYARQFSIENNHF